MIENSVVHNEVVDYYIRENLNPSLRGIVLRTFYLFNLYGLNDYENDIFNVLSAEDQNDPGNMQDTVLDIIEYTVNYILMDHTLILTPETNLHTRNEFLWALYQLQDLNDYTIIIDIIEDSNISDEEKLAMVISNYSTLTVPDVLIAVEQFNSAILDKLLELSYNIKEVTNNPDVYYQRIAIGRVYVYNQFVKDTYKCIDTSAINMTDNGIVTYKDFDNYIMFFKDYINSSGLQLAADYLSVIYMSKNWKDDPIALFLDRQHKIGITDLSIGGIIKDMKTILSAYKEKIGND